MQTGKDITWRFTAVYIGVVIFALMIIIKVLFLQALPANLSIQERCDRMQALNVACLTINKCDLDILASEDG